MYLKIYGGFLHSRKENTGTRFGRTLKIPKILQKEVSTIENYASKLLQYRVFDFERILTSPKVEHHNGVSIS